MKCDKTSHAQLKSLKIVRFYFFNACFSLSPFFTFIIFNETFIFIRLNVVRFSFKISIVHLNKTKHLNKLVRMIIEQF